MVSEWPSRKGTPASPGGAIHKIKSMEGIDLVKECLTFNDTVYGIKPCECWICGKVKGLNKISLNLHLPSTLNGRDCESGMQEAECIMNALSGRA